MNATEVKDFPPFLRETINNPPHAGEGVNNWLFRVARNLHEHLPRPQIEALLANLVHNCGRHVPRSEIERAVENSWSCRWQRGNRPANESHGTQNKWPEMDKPHREAILSEGYTLADLQDESPLFPNYPQPITEAIIYQLFPGNPLLCCGKSSQAFNTMPREEWYGKLAELALIVPSPMTALTGLTKEGRESAHCLSNTGPRRFLIVEFDIGTADEHACLLHHLATMAPLVMAVHSGGKSLHGWFYCAGQTDERLLKFMRYAVGLGADKATWTRSQFVRMPDGTRDNGKRQSVFYLNTSPIKS